MLADTRREPQSLRWTLGLATVAVVVAIMVLLEAPELSSLRWIVAVMTVLAVGGLVLLTHDSRWRVGLTIVLMLFAALLSAAAMLNVADSYVHAISALLAATVFVGTLTAVTASGVLLAATRWSFRVVPVLRFVLTVVAGTLAYFALTPWACDDSMAPGCSSAFGVGLPYDSPLPAVLGGVGVGAAVWLLTSRRRSTYPEPMGDESARVADADLAVLGRFEEAMWRSETRGDRDWMDRRLAPTFTEFGRSGHRYTRDDILALDVSELDAAGPLRDLQFRVLSADVVLVTYQSEIAGERANRSSVWRLTDSGWQMEFHQGTPAQRT